MELDCEDGIELITTAYEQNNRDEEYQFYLQLVPNMDSDSFITFDEFYKVDSVNGSMDNYTQEDTQSIYNNVEDILSEFEFGDSE